MIFARINSKTLNLCYNIFMKKLKFHLTCILFILFMQAAHSKSFVSFFTPEKPQITLSQRFEYNLMHDMKNENFGISSIAMVDAKELKFGGGFYANSKSSDVAIEGYYAPLFWNFVSFGLRTKYHHYKYSDVFVEHNFLGGFHLNFNIHDVWNLYLDMGLIAKHTILNAYKSNINIYDKVWFFDTGCFFTPFEDWSFFLTVSNISLFEDNLLGVFLFDTGFNYKISKMFSIGSDIYFKWEDASVPFDSFNQIGARVNWGIHF